MAERLVDLNADLGESYGPYRYGNDDELMPVITSANIACGVHAGDPTTMLRAVESAVAHGVRIGAHMGLPDRLGFGRRRMAISPADAYALTLVQVASLAGSLRPFGTRLHHAKPHGALYMMAAEDEDLADAVARAIADAEPGTRLYALPDGALAAAGRRHGLVVVPEWFADRPYTDGRVRMFDWTADEVGGPAEAAARVRRMLVDPGAGDIATVCVHSDTPRAPAIARAVRNVLAGAGHLAAA